MPLAINSRHEKFALQKESDKKARGKYKETVALAVAVVVVAICDHWSQVGDTARMP